MTPIGMGWQSAWALPLAWRKVAYAMVNHQMWLEQAAYLTRYRR